MEIKNLLTGWLNVGLDFFDLLDKETKLLAEQRLKVCDTCEVRAFDTCSKNHTGVVQKDFHYIAKNENRKKGETYSGCGCPLSAKLKSDSQCPLAKW